MKNQFTFISHLPLFLLLVSVVLLSSCTKTTMNPNSNTEFLGTYVGNAITNNVATKDTVIITAGTTNSNINVLATQGNTKYIAQVSGYSIAVQSQPAVVSSSGIEVNSGSGLLNNGSLTFTINGTYSGGAPFIFSFSGEKGIGY